MSLQDWLKSGWLKTHRTSPQEIADLLTVADRDIQACETPGLIADWRLNIAYNAALQVAAAALAAAGYQADRTAYHYRVIQSLAFTMGTKEASIRKLDSFRKKRNAADYERAFAVSDLEAEEVRQLAKQLRAEITSWLAKHHPSLV